MAGEILTLLTDRKLKYPFIQQQEDMVLNTIEQ
jgi:hypothetical protein